MHILILSHERSLNKTKVLMTELSRSHRLTLVVEHPVATYKTYIFNNCQILVAENFALDSITQSISDVEKVICTSENLLPIQSQIEAHYKIQNINERAAKVLSNKFQLHKFCLSIGLQSYCPQTCVPFSSSQFFDFDGPVILKPDIGTGSNRFLPPEFHGIEYKIWPNPQALLDELEKRRVLQSFFELNRQTIKIPRFNNKACQMMLQEVIQPTETVYSPCGLYRKGVTRVAFYMQTRPLINWNSQNCSTAGDIAVSVQPSSQVPPRIVQHTENFVGGVLSALAVKDIFFAGPDFYIQNGRAYAIDFNPRLGHFFNLFSQFCNPKIFDQLWSGEKITQTKHFMWSSVPTKSREITSLRWMEQLKNQIPDEASHFRIGDLLPTNPSLQSKPKSIQVTVSGQSESELNQKFLNYTDVINHDLGHEIL